METSYMNPLQIIELIECRTKTETFQQFKSNELNGVFLLESKHKRTRKFNIIVASRVWFGWHLHNNVTVHTPEYANILNIRCSFASFSASVPVAHPLQFKKSINADLTGKFINHCIQL